MIVNRIEFLFSLKYMYGNYALLLLIWLDGEKTGFHNRVEEMNIIDNDRLLIIKKIILRFKG